MTKQTIRNYSISVFIMALAAFISTKVKAQLSTPDSCSYAYLEPQAFAFPFRPNTHCGSLIKGYTPTQAAEVYYAREIAESYLPPSTDSCSFLYLEPGAKSFPFYPNTGCGTLVQYNPADGALIYYLRLIAAHSGGSGGSGWLLTGNAGTSPARNFLGTKDNVSLLFKVDNLKSAWIGDDTDFNTSFGFEALISIANAKFNSAFGDGAGSAITSGEFNTVMGAIAGVGITTGSSNTIIGVNAYGNNGTGNTAVGDSTLANTNGNFNSCFGYQARCGTHQSNSTAIGYGAIASSNNQVVLGNTSVNSFVFNGDLEPGLGNYGTPGQVLKSQGSGVAPQWQNESGGSGWSLTGNSGTSPATNFLGTTDTATLVFKVNNIQVGWVDGGYSINSYFNTFLGFESGNKIQTGYANVGIGYVSQYNNTNGYRNTAVGNLSLENNTAGFNNTAIGFGAGQNWMGNNAIFIGNSSSTTTGLLTRRPSGLLVDTNISTTNYLNDTVGGSGAKPSIATQTQAAMLGGNSPISSFAIGTKNSIVFQLMQNNLYAGLIDAVSQNTYYGLNANTGNNGTANTAMGYHSLGGSYIGCTGNDNVSVGLGNLGQMESGNLNTNIGYDGGRGAFINCSYTTGAGAYNLFSMGTSISNTAVGYAALYSTTGDYVTAIGDSAGFTNTTGLYNTFLGYKADASVGNLTNATAIGSKASVTASNTIQIGNSSVTNFNLGGGAYNIPIQITSVTTGTVVANGAQVLEFTGSTPSVQVTEPANPQTGQQWEITGTGVAILTWTNPGNFYMTPPTAINLGTAPNFYGHAFYYDGTKWVQKY